MKHSASGRHWLRTLHEQHDRNRRLAARIEDLAALSAPVANALVATQIEDVEVMKLVSQSQSQAICRGRVDVAAVSDKRDDPTLRGVE